MKRYLLTMAIFLAVAVIAGVVVWYLYQHLRPAALEDKFEVETSAPAPEQDAASPDVQSQEEETSYTISVDSLSPTQKSMLQSFGINGSEFVVTEAMLTCAKAGVGEERLDFILNGSAPTPYEAMKLLPCMKAE